MSFVRRCWRPGDRQDNLANPTVAGEQNPAAEHHLSTASWIFNCKTTVRKPTGSARKTRLLVSMASNGYEPHR